MKNLYETPEGHLVAAECLMIVATDLGDGWSVGMVTHPEDGANIIAADLTEQEAKMIVRKLFDYGVYTGV